MLTLKRGKKLLASFLTMTVVVAAAAFPVMADEYNKISPNVQSILNVMEASSRSLHLLLMKMDFMRFIHMILKRVIPSLQFMVWTAAKNV